jgi:hypothetical protein
MLLPGCAGSTSGADDCTSRYEPIASGPTRHALARRLLQVDPRVRSLRVLDSHGGGRKVGLNLLNRRHRVVMSLDMWRRKDGTWTAQRWSQCID